MTSIVLRKILPMDAKKFMTLRFKALTTDPAAFVATLDEEQSQTIDQVEQYLTKNYALGAFTALGELVGTLVYMEQDRKKFRHIGILGGMYVVTAHRRTGLAKKLLTAMLDILKDFDHLHSLQLKVITGNIPAIHLYEQFGFLVWATEQNALFDHGEFFDQHHMMKIMD